MRTWVLWLCLLAVPARADEAADVERIYHESARQRKRLMIALTAGGVVSTIAGVGIMVPDSHDQAWRVGGGVTLGFGVVNALLGGFALRGIMHEKPITSRKDLLAQSSREGLVFGINLGLDVAYLMASATAILASQLGVDNSERWLAGGVTGAVQAVFLVGIDIAGVLIARKTHARLLAW
jgi:hypothetical protein